MTQIMTFGLSQWMLPFECVEEKAFNSFHALLTFIYLPSFTFDTFLIIWPLSPYCFSGGELFTYIFCAVCYHMIVAPYVRSVGHVFAYLFSLDDDAERPMDYEISILRKFFPFTMTQIMPF